MPADTQAEAAIRAALPIIAEQGWTLASLRAGMRAAGLDAAAAPAVFPRGVAGAIRAWAALADRDMAAAAEQEELLALRIPQRIRRLVEIRLQQAAPHRRALQRALQVLACRPWDAAAITARTADAIWQAAGDTSTDLSHHTRRASLGGIYAATLAYWLRDGDTAAAMEFLDRRLAGLHRFQTFTRRLKPAA